MRYASIAFLAFLHVGCTDSVLESPDTSLITAESEPIVVDSEESAEMNTFVAFLAIKTVCDSGYLARSCFLDEERGIPTDETMLPIELVVEQRGTAALITCWSFGHPPRDDLVQDCRDRLKKVIHR